MFFSLAAAGGCGDEDNGGGQQSGTEEPPTSEPANWDSVKIEVEGESTLPDNCTVRELTIESDGSWQAEGCGEDEEFDGQLTQEELEGLDERIQAVIPDLSEETCESVVGFDNVEVELTVDGEESLVADVDEDDSRVCYRGGREDAQALRDYLSQLRQEIGGNVGGGESPET